MYNNSFPTRGRHKIKTMIHFIYTKMIPNSLANTSWQAYWNQSSHSGQSQRREITMNQSELDVKIIQPAACQN